MIMDDKLKALQEGNQEVSPVLSENQSPQPTEQEGAALKSTDVCPCKADTAQDCDSSPMPLMREQMHRPVSIAKITLLDEGSPVITLRIQNYFSEEIKFAEVKLDALTPQTLKKCVIKNGGMSTGWKILFDVLMKDIIRYKQNTLIEIKHGHTKLGWSERTDGIVFNHQHSISSDNKSSEYMGKVDIKPKGSLGNIIEMIKRWILSTSEWSPLEAIIAFSVASVVLPFAKYAWGKIINNLILHLLGNSTSGKSTSLRLHVGLASNPFNEKNGFWLNHQSSLDALIRRIGNNQGLPVSIDELSSASKKKYTKFVYAIGNGEEKDRLKAGGTALADSANFSTIALSSGEQSILKKCDEAAGIRARCVELRNVEWTESKEQADSIYDCLSDNYGWVAPLVAEELLNNSDKWNARWDEIYDQIKSQMDKDQIRLAIGPRICEFVVLFTLAAEIANKVLNISLHVNEIRDFCYLHIITGNADEANVGERAYEYLLRYANENPEDFPELMESMVDTYWWRTSKIKGFFRDKKRARTINGKKYWQQLVLFRDTYEKILEDGGFSPDVVSHELRDARFLQVKDGKRYTYPLVYNNLLQNFYCIYTNQEDDLIFEAMADGTYKSEDEDENEG